jgi:hypothetical protein
VQANGGGVRAGTTAGTGVRANIGGVRAGTTAGANVRANVGGVRAGTNIDGVRVGANVDGVRAGTNVDGVRANVGVGGRTNIAGAVGVGPVGVGFGPGWRYGGFYAGMYRPGWWWWNNRWYGYPPYGYGYGGYYGDGYASGSYAQPTQVAAEYTGPGVGIHNPTEHTINFTLDGEKEMTAGPGETVRLTEFADYQISFDRGDNFGTATYTVYEGLYEFAQTDRGWELYRQKDDADARTAERPMTPDYQSEAPEDAPRSEAPTPPRAGAPY